VSCCYFIDIALNIVKKIWLIRNSYNMKFYNVSNFDLNLGPKENKIHTWLFKRIYKSLFERKIRPVVIILIWFFPNNSKWQYKKYLWNKTCLCNKWYCQNKYLKSHISLHYTMQNGNFQQWWLGRWPHITPTGAMLFFKINYYLFFK
jgi:hypothetical protein